MAKQDILVEEKEQDQDTLTLQDQNLIETYSKNKVENKKKSKFASKNQHHQKSLHKNIVSNDQLANNEGELDTSDEEVRDIFVIY